ncbi:MAG: DUF192 domain-containing protein [Spirochaetes bacterium]|nr:DUF192 domain-containing protein [Spirochaetota bacterium]
MYPSHGIPAAAAAFFRRLPAGHRLILATIVAAALAVSCARGSQSAGNRPETAQPRLKEAVLRIGEVEIAAELAIAPDQQSRGLMFREKLDDGHGMLFVNDRDRRLGFWMKDTKLPLSIAYIDSSGVIREIHDMEPYSLASIDSETSLRYALEVPRGWFGRVGIQVGDRVDLPPEARSP